ncbi:MAG: hypothetical protein WAM82_26955 [Thermoanaerobaculia bacterium]
MSTAPKLTETDEASAKPGNSEPISATGAVPLTEKEQLEVEKLRLEVRELGHHWLQRPQNLSAVSAITLGIIGLIWAISNGFFSITRSELEIKRERLLRETSELQKQRETQLASLYQLRHDVEQAKQALSLSESKARKAKEDEMRARSDEKRAKETVVELDRPLLLHAFIVGGPWLPARDPEFEINLEAINIGKDSGTVKVETILGCRLVWSTPKDFYSNKWKIKRWDSTGLAYGGSVRHGLITLSFPADPNSLRAQLRSVTNERFSNETPGPCEYYVLIHMTRADGKESVTPVTEELEGAYSFVYGMND